MDRKTAREQENTWQQKHQGAGYHATITAQRLQKVMRGQGLARASSKSLSFQNLEKLES